MQLPIDLPPSEDELFGRTTCGQCNSGPFPQSEGVPGVISVGSHTLQEVFCSFDCRDKWRDEKYVPVYLGIV